jgi:hypothetical protein
MSQSGYTPLSLYSSVTATNTPLAANLVNGELAINITDGKLFYKDNLGVVQVIASKAGNVNVSSFSAGSTGLTPNTATTGAVTLGGTLNIANGGTGITSFGTGVQTALGQNVTGSGSIVLSTSPTLVTPALGTPSALVLTNATGLPASSITGTLGVANGGTGLSTLTAGYIPYGNGTSAFGSSANLAYDGTKVTIANSASGATVEVLRLSNSGAGANTAAQLTFYSPSSIYASISGGYGAAAPQMTFNLPSVTLGNYVWQNNSTEQMRLDSSGNLGIGTSSPASKLVVSNAGGAGFEVNPIGSASAPALYSYNRTTSLYDILTFVSSEARWQTGVSPIEVMRLDTSGNLGLGITPSAWVGSKAIQLPALGSIAGGYDYSMNTAFNLYRVGSGAWNYIQSGQYAVLYSQSAGHNWYTAPIGTAGNTATLTQAMTLDNSGNLLVGTTSNPSLFRLVVSGGASTIGAAFTKGAANQYGIQINNTTAAYTNYVDQDGIGSNSWSIYDTTNTQNMIRYYPSSSGFWQFYTNNIERMRIDSSGNVGIGTTSPSYKLQVTNSTSIDTELAVTNPSGIARFGTRASGNAFAGAFTAGKSFELWSSGNLNATLDSSGNLGLGVTPEAWSGFKSLDFSAVSYSGLGNIRNAFYNGSSYIYRSTAAAAQYQLGSTGTHNWFVAPSGTAGNAISFTTAMTLDNSGNLGLNVTPVFTGAAYRSLESFYATGLAFDTNNPVTNVISSTYHNGTDWLYKLSGYGASRYAVGAGAHYWYNAPSGTAGNAITFTQAMTLANSGNLLVGTTSDNGYRLALHYSSGPYVTDFYNSNTSTNQYNVSLWRQASSGSAIGYIGTGGSAVSNAAFANNFVIGTQTSSPLVFSTADTERMRIHASGGVSIGNTTDPGATNLSVTGNVVAAKIYTGNGSTASTASGTPVTIYTMPAEATIMITAYLSGSGAPATYNAVAIVKSSGSVAAITTISSATNMTLSLSGLNVEATQVSGISQVITYQYTRLS